MSKQLHAMHNASQAQSALALIEFLQEKEVRVARKCVREVLSKKDIKEWTEDERDCASAVVANYDVAGALIRSELVPVDLILENWGPSIEHCYHVLRPFIEEHRGKQGGQSAYWKNFEWLNEKSRH